MRFPSRFFKYSLFFTIVLTACDNKNHYQSEAIEVFPPHELFNVALFRMNNLNISPAYFKGKWSIVLLAHSPCDSKCKRRLELLNSVDKAQKLLVFNSPATTHNIQLLTTQFANVSIAMGTNAPATDFFFEQFSIEQIASTLKFDYLYFVNPAGQIQHALALKGINKKIIESELYLFKTNK